MGRGLRNLAAMSAVAAAVVALTGGVSWLSGHAGRGGPGVPEPTNGRDLQLTLSYVGRTPVGPRLFTETHAVPGSRDPALTVAVRAMLTDVPRDGDYHNYLLRSHLRAKAVERDGSILIDFSKPPERGPDMDDATVRLVVQALVHAADDAAGDDLPVRFAVAGTPVDSVLGVDTSQPVKAVRDTTVDSPVSIDAPAENSFVPYDAVVRGRAATSDGRVYWTIYRLSQASDPAPVASGHTATGRSDEFTPYSFHLPRLRLGSYYVVVGGQPDLSDPTTPVDSKVFSVPVHRTGSG